MPPPSKIPPPVAPKPGTTTTKILKKLTTPINNCPRLKFVSSISSGQVTNKINSTNVPNKIAAPPNITKSINKIECQSQNISGNISPPDSPTMTPSRHRRNVSDTSAFNK